MYILKKKNDKSLQIVFNKNFKKFMWINHVSAIWIVLLKEMTHVGFMLLLISINYFHLK